MRDVGDQRLANAEERITEFNAEKIAAHKQLSGAGNPIQEGCIGISSGDIPYVQSESNGNHLQAHAH